MEIIPYSIDSKNWKDFENLVRNIPSDDFLELNFSFLKNIDIVGLNSLLVNLQQLEERNIPVQFSGVENEVLQQYIKRINITLDMYGFF